MFYPHFRCAGRVRWPKPVLLALIISFCFLQSEARAQEHVGITTASDDSQLLVSSGPPGCPNQEGILDSISVPVGKPLDLVVVIFQPAPRGGATFELSSDDPAIVVVGDRRQSFLPRVFIPEGQRESNPFTIFGIKVGRTVLRITPRTPGFSPSQFPLGAWDVGKEGANKFLDANPSSNHCRRSDTSPDFSTDPAVLSNCGAPVQGIASDGVSRLLLRAVSGLPGTACYAIVSSSSLDQGSIQTAVTRTQTVRNTEYAFSLYQAPGFYGDSTDSRDVEVEFTFTPSIGNGNTTRFRAKATIVRPPVVLIHGLWSNNATWSRDDFIRNDRSHTTFAADYQATNDARFAKNFNLVKLMVDWAIQNHRIKGPYATTQADIIAHSMGGLLTRLYIGSPPFKRPENLNQGDIHRLITLDTPHFGSNFANLIVALHRQRPEDTETTVANLIPGGARVTNGAVCDLSENSPALQSLAGGTAIRAQVITATGGPAGTPANPARFWGGVFGIRSFEAALTQTRCVARRQRDCILFEHVFPQDIVDAFRFREQNDAIVPLSSQQGGATTGTNFPNFLHFGVGSGRFTVVSGVTNTRAVANQAFGLLDGPNDRLVASLPGVLSNGTGAPRTVRGRGGMLDQQDFTNQCGPGGPMRGTPALDHPEDQEMVAAEPQNATSEPQLAADARVRVTAPVSGQRFAPGDRLSIVVQITPPLTANDIGVNLPGLTHLEGTNYTGSRYEAIFVIPDFYAGPLAIVPSITDTNNTPITGVGVTVAVRPATPPSSLFLVQRSYNLTFPTTAAGALHATGVYPDGVERDLSSSATGTQYQSSNTAVIRVDSEGVVQVAGPGTAVVTADNSGVKDFATFVVENPLNPLPPEDVTTQVSLAMSGFRLDRQTGFFVQEVTLTSSVSTPIAGPLYLVVTGLTPGVTLVNKSGVTENIQPTGSPYFALSPDGDGVTFRPEQTITLQLQFLNPSRLRIDYLFKVFRTSRIP